MKAAIQVMKCGLVFLLLSVTACNNKESEKKESTISDTVSNAAVDTIEVPSKRGPIINITDTLSIKRTVIAMRDSAATFEGVGVKLAAIYGTKLAEIITKNKLEVTGAPIAWYKTNKAPYFFEAGIPVAKKPAKLPKGVVAREIGIDSVVVAHFYGPYDLLPQAYEALGDWVKNHKKTIKGTPYEIYVGDPMDADGKPKDPYKVQTDVIFHWK